MTYIDIERLFENERGKRIYDAALKTIQKYKMAEKLSGGVLVGFSGGADSVMLLCVLKKYARENGSKSIIALHINHMIRGEEAERDERFSRDFCAALGINFIAEKRDVPAEAKRLSKGLEETARDIRYSIFRDLLRSRNDIVAVAVAHNSTDNLETVLLNLMRGAGSRGASGIPPVRDHIIRPLISVSKSDITSALDEADIPYVVDSTNLETDYRRNFVRADIIPSLRKLTEDPEGQAIRFTENLRSDDSYIREQAEAFLSNGKATVSAHELKALHPAVFSRAVTILAKRGGASGIERVHIDKIRELILSGGDFSVSLSGGVSFISENGEVIVGVPKGENSLSYEKKLFLGKNYIAEIDAEIILSKEPIDKSSLKIYNFSIQQTIDFDIIKGDLFVREKRDGDSYTYGGITRKLKKLFNDRSIPPSKRPLVPIICDDLGILWVSGFGVRDGGSKKPSNPLYIAVVKA